MSEKKNDYLKDYEIINPSETREIDQNQGVSIEWKTKGDTFKKFSLYKTSSAISSTKTQLI